MIASSFLIQTMLREAPPLLERLIPAKGCRGVKASPAMRVGTTALAMTTPTKEGILLLRHNVVRKPIEGRDRSERQPSDISKV